MSQKKIKLFVIIDTIIIIMLLILSSLLYQYVPNNFVAEASISVSQRADGKNDGDSINKSINSVPSVKDYLNTDSFKRRVEADLNLKGNADEKYTLSNNENSNLITVSTQAASPKKAQAYVKAFVTVAKKVNPKDILENEIAVVSVANQQQIKNKKPSLSVVLSAVFGGMMIISLMIIYLSLRRTKNQ
ncbi:hypothetical protein ACUIJP_07470 [Leuconostoc pseudomesenteroides]|uniref:hypothetical protein n=1 Tax=Leuconostoc pseudomesenteroides TaxID=33968 RepID=UPI00403D9F33